MSNVSIRKVASLDDHSLPVFAEMDQLMKKISARARELYELHRRERGHALDDWLQAEHEFCWPAAELVERDKDYVLSFAVPGYQPGELELTVTPREIILHARCREERSDREGELRWTEFRSNDVYRRIELPGAIEPDKVTTSFHFGMLKVEAPKAVPVATGKDVAEAA